MILLLILHLLFPGAPTPCVTMPGLTYVCTVTVLPPKTVVIGQNSGG